MIRTQQPHPVLNKLAEGLSPSSASTFRQCRRRWKLRYVDRLPDPSGEAALRGTFVHEVLENLLKLPAGERTEDTARELCRDSWAATEENADFRALGLSDKEQKAFRWDAWGNIVNYFGSEDPSRVNVASTEQDVRVRIGDVPFRGVVDLVERTEQGLRVTDYKTGKIPRRAYLSKTLSQVWLYAAALEETGADVSEVRLLYLSSTDRNDIRRLFDADTMNQAAAEHRDTWTNIHEAVRTDAFPPTTGPLCSWCPYRAECPEGRDEHRRRQRWRR